MKKISPPGVVPLIPVSDLGKWLTSGTRFLVFASLFLFLSAPVEARKSRGGRTTSSVRVKGYVKRSGKYVSPHHRTHADASKTNNWSTKGNLNPYTGKTGAVNP